MAFIFSPVLYKSSDVHFKIIPGQLFNTKPIIMKKFLLYIFLPLFLFQGIQKANAQLSISDNGDNPPDNSAILDLQSSNKGLLLPRIDFNDRPDPAAAGLLIFVTANGPYGNNALYFYNGSNWVKVSEANISVGDQREGGIVFYVDSTGLHGLIAAPFDQDQAPWGCGGTLIGPGAEFPDIGWGDVNSNEILNNCGDDPMAALVCDTLTQGGYDDWYLPSVNSLQEMYNHQDVIGNFDSGQWYWSSTEQDEGGAWIVLWGDGSSGWTDKNTYFNVRCVRKF